MSDAPTLADVGSTAWSVVLAVVPLAGLFLTFQWLFLRLPAREVSRILAGTLIASLLQAAREQTRAKVAAIEAKRNFWLASTDLSVAMLGGGIASQPDAVIATTSSGTNAE